MKLIELFNPDAKIDDSAKETVSSVYSNMNAIQDKGKISYITKENLFSKLSVLGWSIIGDGAYSVVFENPDKDNVLKINIRPDLGFEKFVQFIRTHPNKYFPRISDSKIIDINGYIYRLYLIEKLYPISPGDSLVNIIDKILKYYWVPVKKLFPGGVPLILLNNPLLVRAIKLTRREAQRSGYMLDIHWGNIMKRKDGTYVIIDPYSCLRLSRR